LKIKSKIRGGRWDEPLREKVIKLGQGDGDDLTIFDAMDCEKINDTSVRVKNAHVFGVSIACCKNDLVKYYNDQGLRDATIKFYFFSYDTSRESSNLELSSINESIDKFLEIESRTSFGIGSPIRVLRSVVAMNGMSTKIFPKNSIGIFLSANINNQNHLLSTACIEFREGRLTWTSNIEMVCEEFDSSDFTESSFFWFFQRFSHRTFLPLKLAYAVTINSLQGLEFDNLIFDMTSIGDWIKHALYMGVTRVRSPRGIWCINVPEADNKFNDNDRDTLRLYDDLKSVSKNQGLLDDGRKESLVTMDLVQILENFKVTF